MLQFHGFLSSCMQIHRSGYFIPGFPYKWEKGRLINTFKVTNVKKKSWKLWFTILCVLSILNAHSVWLFMKERNVTKFSLGVVSFTGLTVASCILWCTSVKADPFVKFLNGLMEMEGYFQKQELLHKYDNLSDFGLLNRLCKLFGVAGMLTPWLLGIGSVITPCSPPNLLVSLMQSCKTSPNMNSESLLTKMRETLFIMGLNVIFWKAVIEAGVLASIHILIGCKCQVTMLKALKRSTEKVNSKILVYRKLHILCSLFNESHVGILFATLVGASVMQTCILYILFQAVQGSSSYSMTIPAPVMAWNVLFAGITMLIILFIFGTAGSLHGICKKNIMKAMVNTGYTPREGNVVMLKWKGAFLRSCAPVRVAFGTSNFVENNTPLKFLDFSINRFVDLLLMGKKKYGVVHN